jgi:hydrogenase maturation protein HypF
MWLEAIAAPVSAWPRLGLGHDDDGVLRIDWAPLVHWLLEEPGRPAAERAGGVHASLAEAIVAVAVRLRDEHGTALVGLTGGVFQNRRLTELAADALAALGFRVLMSNLLPCNDGGLSYGQVTDFAGRCRE